MADESNTLIIKHLPHELQTGDCEDLLKHFGAAQVRTMGKQGRLKHTAFATFANGEEASQALRRLHQLEVLGSKLVVEFSKKAFAKHHPSLCDPPSKYEDNKDTKDAAEKAEALRQEQKKQEDLERQRIVDRLNAVAPQWGVNYSYNPKLQYMYPPPTVSVLTNIAHALASVPRFYVQVLHLMNKMNLPAPFGKITPTPPLPEEKPPTPAPLPADDMDLSSSEESELESEEENPQKASVKLATKRDYFPGKEPKAKRPRAVAPMPTKTLVVEHKPSSQLHITAEEAFEKPSQAGLQKKIAFSLSVAISETVDATSNPEPVKLVPEDEKVPPPPPPVTSAAPHPPLLTNIPGLFSTEELQKPIPDAGAAATRFSVHDGGFGMIEPQNRKQETEEEEEEEEEWGATEFISSRKLHRGKISRSEMKNFSVFKNYDSGEPTTRLYIKNLAKQVTEKELHYIYGKYVSWEDDIEKNMFDIRLMKEGRMKGQAFVTLPQESAAKEALEDTNRFVMHGKPMVVQFARSAKPKENDGKASKK